MKQTTWHYNLIREKGFLTVREVYVDIETGKEDKISWTDEPIKFGGETREEVVESLEVALKDIKKHKIYNIDTKQVEEETRT